MGLGFISFYFFAKYFPREDVRGGGIRDILILVLSLILPLTLVTDLVTKSELVMPNGERATEFGPLYPVYIALLIITTIFTFANLINNYKNVPWLYKVQIKVFISGIFMAVLFGFMTNIVLPLIGIFDLQKFGQLATLFLSSTMAFLILRHGFLNIKIILAKVIEYVILALFTYLFFYLIIFTEQILFQGSTSAQALFLGVPLAIIFIAFINSLKTIVSQSVYDKILYRDFNPIVEINQTNKQLALEINVDKLVTIITNRLKIDLNLKNVDITLDTKLFPSHNNFNHDFESFIKLFSIQSTNFIILDEYLLQNETYQEIANSLKRKGIQVIFKISEAEIVYGYLLIYQKVTGSNIFYTHELDFIESLTDAFLSALKKSELYREITKFNKELQSKVHIATKELETQNVTLDNNRKSLQKAYTQLKTLDEAKSDFISIASHQLRTPLSVIKGYLSMVNSSDYGTVNSEQKRVLSLSLNALNDLNNVINEILTSSRIEKGAFTITKSDVDLKEMLDYIHALYKNKFDEKKLKFVFEYPINLKTYPVNIDKDKFEQVIINLVENAFNYTQQGQVTVTLKNEPESFLLSVTDTGIGISREDQSKLFEKFVRLDNAKKIRPDGTGIGLYTAKVIVKQHGGKIWIKSKVGVGTTFFVEVPKK